MGIQDNNSSGHARKLAFTVEEVGVLISVSRAQLYRLIDIGDLKTIKIGRSRRVTLAQLEAFLTRREQEHGFVRR